MFNNIQNTLIDLDYGMTKWGTLIVFVPGFSALTYKLKEACFEKIIKDTFQSDQNVLQSAQTILSSSAYFKLQNIRKWHAFGAGFRIGVFMSLTNAVNPFFCIPAIISIFEFIYVVSRCRSSKWEITSENNRYKLNAMQI